MHEAFIKLLFIAIDVFNGENTKSFYDFSNSIFYNCRYVILDFQSHSRRPRSRGEMSYMGMCFSEREPTQTEKRGKKATSVEEKYTAHQIFTCHITE